jgi:hypothetical protein
LEGEIPLKVKTGEEMIYEPNGAYNDAVGLRSRLK